jgi:cysteinyl-tRNA synthetase
MLNVYNTLSRKKEPFIPLHPPFVGIYVCGPTVYDDPHLGHAKSYISFDIVVRLLRAEGFKVRYVQNITDVGHLLDDDEDRVIQRARIERLEPVEIAQKYERHFFRDMDSLNCVRPDISCRATGYIPEIIELIQELIKKGYAYVVEGNVYFEVSKFKNYGKLAGRKIEDLIEGKRIKVAEGKRQPVDFALWKKTDDRHLMQWSSPWGRGYPGWHMECSVMSMKYLGETIDIHGGGLDNQFPHHECEIAQSEAVTGKLFVKYWLHNNMVTMNGQKMSKSIGNYITLKELFKKYHPMTVRFFILQGHYRSPQDFSDQALDAAQKGFERLIKAVLYVREKAGNEDKGVEKKLAKEWSVYKDRFYNYLEDDFNTSGAVSVLFDLVKHVNNLKEDSERVQEFESADFLFKSLGERVLGLRFDIFQDKVYKGEMQNKLIDLVINIRKAARDREDWQTADEIRIELEKIGIEVKDSKHGTTWTKLIR